MNTITDVEAMAPYELLHDARRLLAGGDVIPAAVMARAALDTWMRGRVALLGRQRRYVGLRCYTDVLRHFGTISLDQAATLRRLLRIGSRAAHNYATLACDVEEMIGVVAELVSDE